MTTMTRESIPLIDIDIDNDISYESMSSDGFDVDILEALSEITENKTTSQDQDENSSDIPSLVDNSDVSDADEDILSLVPSSSSSLIRNRVRYNDIKTQTSLVSSQCETDKVKEYGPKRDPVLFHNYSSEQEKNDKEQQSQNEYIDMSISTNHTGNLLEVLIAYVAEIFSCSTNCSPGKSILSQRQIPTYTSRDNFQQWINTFGNSCCFQCQLPNKTSTEDMQQWIHSLGQSICFQCHCSSHVPDANDDSNILSTNNHITDVETMNVHTPKSHNRNVYNRQKALNRIRRLRQGGLSRNFYSEPISSFLDEDEYSKDKDMNTSTITSNCSSSPSKNGTHGYLLPLSKRPKSISAEKRQTSFSVNSALDYNSITLATQSNEYDGYQYTQEKQNKSCGAFDSMTDHRVLTKIFSLSNLYQEGYLEGKSEAEFPNLYYDSDPGTYDGKGDMNLLALRKTTFTKKSKGRSKTIGDTTDIAADLKKLEWDVFESKKSLISSLNIVSFDVNDDDCTSQVIKELLASDFLFIWHPNYRVEDRNGSSTVTPHRVKAWFEMGSCLKKTLVQPKLVWRSNDNFKYGSRQSTIKNIRNPEFVDLLNIVKIVAPTTIDRETYPFVKYDCAFVILTNIGQEILFEVATKDERDKLLFVFKLMIARLASKIIVGDEGVFDDFFASFGASNKNGKSRRRKKKKKKNSKVSKVISITEANNGRRRRRQRRRQESDCVSVATDISGFSKAIIETVQDESARTDELWGTM